VCPTKAIRLSTDFELSVKNKQDLYQETTFATTACLQCGKPFTSYKELNYVIELEKQQADDPTQIAQKQQVMHICPDCKRQNSLEKMAYMTDNMWMKLITYNQANVGLDFSESDKSAVEKNTELVGGERG
ncbi:MAG TPA: hydrogenase, partial [Pasteurellaceae bacterium]|nr:hydrogenase [Pasteurellaceae bacterium]